MRRVVHGRRGRGEAWYSDGGERGWGDGRRVCGWSGVALTKAAGCRVVVGRVDGDGSQ